MPPEIDVADERLGKAIVTQDSGCAKRVWAEDVVVKAPNKAILRREEVVAAMPSDRLEDRSFKAVIESVGQRGDATIMMGYETMIPRKEPGAGRRLRAASRISG